jgi:hypothetical protein
MLLTVFAAPALWQEWVDAQSIISANAAPISDQVSPQAQLPEEVANSSDSDGDSDVSRAQVAQAEATRLSEVRSSDEDGTSPSKPHLNYDLDHGVPMELDVRDSRPVY